MASRNAPPPSGSSRSRQRGKPVQVQAKKPIGLWLGIGVLTLLLLGVVAYAVVNQGEGYQDPLEQADAKFGKALVKADPATLGRNHKDGDLAYPVSPPSGGDHSPVWQNCGVYDAQIPDEHAVHSLEHGAVWVTYRPDLPKDQVKTLREAVEGKPYGLLSPYPGQTDAVVLTAWGRRITVSSADDRKVKRFLGTYPGGPQTPEKGAACSGGTQATGAAPLAAPPAPPAPRASVPAG